MNQYKYKYEFPTYSNDNDSQKIQPLLDLISAMFSGAVPAKATQSRSERVHPMDQYLEALSALRDLADELDQYAESRDAADYGGWFAVSDSGFGGGSDSYDLSDACDTPSSPGSLSVHVSGKPQYVRVFVGSVQEELRKLADQYSAIPKFETYIDTYINTSSNTEEGPDPVESSASISAMVSGELEDVVCFISDAKAHVRSVLMAINRPSELSISISTSLSESYPKNTKPSPTIN